MAQTEGILRLHMWSKSNIPWRRRQRQVTRSRSGVGTGSMQFTFGFDRRLRTEALKASIVVSSYVYKGSQPKTRKHIILTGFLNLCTDTAHKCTVHLGPAMPLGLVSSTHLTSRSPKCACKRNCTLNVCFNA